MGGRITRRADRFVKGLRPPGPPADTRSSDEKLADVINTFTSRTRLQKLYTQVKTAKGTD